MRPLSSRWLILSTTLLLLLSACGSSDVGVDTTVSTVATATTQPMTTTTEAPTTTSSTTTTTQPMTTTTAPTTTTAACPDLPSIGMSRTGTGEDVDPGAYKVAWAYPKFTFTVEEPTTVWLGDRFDLFGWKPIPIPQWQHPRMVHEWGALEFAGFDFLLSYDGESEVEIPDDLGEWLSLHPLLETTEPTAVTIDGNDGVQVDAIVVGSHPGTGDSVRFGGYDKLPGQRWLPQGAAMRIILVEVNDTPLWLLLTATEDGFDDATAWSDTIVAGIDFC